MGAGSGNWGLRRGRGGSLQRNNSCPPNLYTGLKYRICPETSRGASAAIEHSASSANRPVAPHRQSAPAPLVRRRNSLFPTQYPPAPIPRVSIPALPAAAAAASSHAIPIGAAARPHCTGGQLCPTSACAAPMQGAGPAELPQPPLPSPRGAGSAPPPPPTNWSHRSTNGINGRREVCLLDLRE
jgi:hypothetical protein